MKPFFPLVRLMALTAGLAALSARATIFDYSYLFGDGLLVSGSLSGDLSADLQFVEHVSNVSVFFNGAAMPGSVYASQYDGVNYLTGAVVSFDVSRNNFFFANSDAANGDLSADSAFYLTGASAYVGAFDGATALSIPLGYASFDGPLMPQSWSLLATTGPSTGVPDGGATFALVGFAVLGLALWRRRMVA